MATVAVVDSNVLVYRVDPRNPVKQRIATERLRGGIVDGSLVLAYQSVVEFHAAVTRPPALLTWIDAARETEELLVAFPVLYPTDNLVRSALRAADTYQLSWYDALIWAYADTNGIEEILSEDFQPDRLYGSVRVINPFAANR